MPAGSKRRVGVLVIAGSVSLLAIGCGGKDQQARDQIAAINKYLGTSADNTNTTLLGNINGNNEYLRKVIRDLQCDIYKINNPSQAPGGACLPGGPSEPPTVVPKYPQ
jgi:hypothetical protein